MTLSYVNELMITLLLLCCFNISSFLFIHPLESTNFTAILNRIDCSRFLSIHYYRHVYFKMSLMQIANYMELEKLVMEMGFLPFFKNEISGFSIEETVLPELWFSEDEDGPWEWKGPVIRNGKCVYGKLFDGKAGFVNLDWYPDLVNYRRASYQFTETEQLIYKALVEYESLLTKDLKTLCGFVKSKRKSIDLSDMAVQTNTVLKTKCKKEKKQSFESAITRLQMGTYVIIADFEYAHKKDGESYGWGIARYTTPEALFGRKIIEHSITCTPEDSKKRILGYLLSILPQATEGQLLKFIG